MAQTFIEIEFTKDTGESEYKEVRFEGFPKLVNLGIGPYEYWGQKCNDVQMGGELEQIDWDERLYSSEENSAILGYLDRNFKKIAHEIMDDADKNKDDFDPPDYDED